MRIKTISLFFIIMPMLFLCGCSDSSQLHQKIIVQGIGVDKENEGYKITVQSFDYQNTTSEEGPNVKVISLNGESVMSALNTISKRTGLEPLYSQNIMIVIGEDAAKDGINKIIDFFIRHYESRPNVKICIARGKAEDVLSCKSGENFIQSKDISDLIDDKSDIVHFVGALHDVNSQPSATALSITQGETPTIIEDGIAVFYGDTLSGFCDENESLGIKLINGRSKGENYLLKLDDGRKVTCVINDSTSKIKTYISDVPEFTVNLDLDIGIFEIEKLNEGDMNGKENLIKNQLIANINDLFRRTIYKVIMEYGSDIFNFGKILMNKNPKYFKGIEDWGRMIKSCRYNINTNIDISVTGTEVTY